MIVLKRLLFIFCITFVFIFSLITPFFALNTAKADSAAAYKIKSSYTSLRVKPSSKAQVVETLKKNAYVVRQDTKTYLGSGLKWYKVQALDSGNTGFIATKYLTKTTLPDYSRLSSLSVSAGVLCPAFKPDVFQYDFYLPEAQNDFALSYAVPKPETAVQVKKGEMVIEGNPAVIAFENGAVLTITSVYQDKTSVYQITMKREDANTAKLQELAFSDIAITPDFNPEVFAYTAGVPYSVIDTTVTAALFNGFSQVNYFINGEKNNDNFLPLMVGKNTFGVEVTSPLGQKNVYTLDVTRAEPSEGEIIHMSALERRFVETAFQLLPERHPFLLAYEEATGRDIKSYSVIKNNYKISGVPFEFGGSGKFKGFSDRWWAKTSVRRYPVGGMDCAEYMCWIYRQMGYIVPDSSAGLFLSGVEGELRNLKGVRFHKVIPSLDIAKIGDIAYNSKDYSYTSGHGNHTAMFLSTARKLGIGDTLCKYYPDFPIDAYLLIDVGWADGKYYHNMIKKTGVKGRSDLGGVGIQFFTSIKGNNGKYVYASPYRSKKKSYAWKDTQSGQIFTIAANLERNRRPVQYKPSQKSSVQYVMNLCRPIHRNDD